jgi:nicotinamide mononucleotide transporter
MGAILAWLTDNYIEVFGAVTGVLYVFLEIRQTLWLWPVGIVTSAVYIWVFFTSKFYADMSLQGYYLVISFLGWYWWVRGTGQGAQDMEKRNESENGRVGERESKSKEFPVTRIRFKTGAILFVVFMILYVLMWVVLSKFTDSPVPAWDSFITSLSIIATWMLARKIFEHWYLWIIVNFVSAVLFIVKGLYPTVILYLIYGIMSFAGLSAWRKTIAGNQPIS